MANILAFYGTFGSFPPLCALPGASSFGKLDIPDLAGSRFGNRNLIPPKSGLIVCLHMQAHLHYIL